MGKKIPKLDKDIKKLLVPVSSKVLQIELAKTGIRQPGKKITCEKIGRIHSGFTKKVVLEISSMTLCLMLTCVCWISSKMFCSNECQRFPFECWFFMIHQVSDCESTNEFTMHALCPCKILIIIPHTVLYNNNNDVCFGCFNKINNTKLHVLPSQMRKPMFRVFTVETNLMWCYYEICPSTAPKFGVKQTK